MNPARSGKTLARKLVRRLRALGKRISPLLIMTHDHPDPDALASAWALSHLVHKLCTARVRIAYGGIVGRRENRIMLASLDIPAFPLRKSDKEWGRTALVDTQPPFRNNQYPKRKHPDIILDHHPLHADTRGDLVLIDQSVGATTTLMAEALIEAGVSIPSRLATAMVYGIGSETQNLGRDAGPRDRAAYMAILPRADMKALWRIANPPRSASFFEMLSRGIRNAFVCREVRVIGVHLRELPTPDRVAQIADFLLTHEGMRWSIVTGRYDGKLHVSLRTHSPSEDAGRLLKRLLGGGNRGGGHRSIAGGTVIVGGDATEEKWRDAEEGVVASFLKTRNSGESESTYPFRNSV